MSAYRIVWIVSGAILVISWLVISFAPPSPRRTVVEWLAATAMYAAILAIFVRLTLHAYATGWVVAACAIGFICAIFGGGLLVTAWKTISALGGERKSESSATN